MVDQNKKSVAPAPGLSPIKRVADEFTREALLKLTALTKLFPPGASPDAVTRFLEEAVAELLQKRLGPKRLIAGILSTPNPEGDPSETRLLEGIVHDPRKGAPTLQYGPLAVMSPQVCDGLINVKSSSSNLAKLEGRLWEVRKLHFPTRPAASVMGVLVRDPQPDKASWLCRAGNRFRAHDNPHPKWCPIYILFAHAHGQYEPFRPAIEAMLANLHRHIHPQY